MAEVEGAAEVSSFQAPVSLSGGCGVSQSSCHASHLGTACSRRLLTQPAARQTGGHWASPGQRPQQVVWPSLNLRVTVAMMALEAPQHWLPS